MALLLTTVSSSLGVIRQAIDEDDSVEGFDTLVMRRRIRAATARLARRSVNLSSNPPTSGDAGNYSYMFCVQRRASFVVCGVYDCEFTYRGILDATKPYKIRGRCFSERQSASAANYPGYSAVPVESNQGLIGITVNYVATTPPALTITGTNQTPPVSLTPPSPFVPPSNIWTSIENPIHVFPYGWVLDAREFDDVPGSDVVLVTDQYVYYHHFKVGG